jgi:hypothetical protein
LRSFKFSSKLKECPIREPHFEFFSTQDSIDHHKSEMYSIYFFNYVYRPSTMIQEVSLFVHLLFYVLLKYFSLIWRRHHNRWKAAKFRLSTQGLWAGRDLHRATPAVTRDLIFSSVIWRTALFSRLLRHTMGCGVPILTWIIAGLQTCSH